MLVDNYNFKITPLANYTPVVLAEAGFFAKEAREKDQLILRMGKDGNGFVQPLETIEYIRNEFGDRKPVCLLAKLLREIKRVIVDTLEFVNGILDNIDDWLDDNIPGWETISSIISENIIEPLLDVLLIASDAILSVFDDVVDFITGIGGC